MNDQTLTATPKPPSELRPNRVPQVTAEFWLIKLMAVTMGETAADYLAVNMGLGLTTTSLIMTGVLVAALVAAVLAQALRALDLLAGRRADLDRRHADHRQPRRQSRRQPGDLHGRLHAGAGR